MLLTDLTQLGDKIDIQLVQQLQMQDRGELEEPLRTYKSSLFEYLSDTEFEIMMPTENGRMVLFQVGLRCKLLFYTRKGMYTCTAIVKNRYKKENFFVLAMQLTSGFEKFQRREFFRIDYLIEMRYVPVSEEVAKLATTEQLFSEIQKPEYIDRYKNGVILDISGGGLRFSAPEQIEQGKYVVAEMRLTNDRFDQSFFLATRIVASERGQNSSDNFICRGQFVFKNLRDRENIVRFVLEEERRIRRKEIR